MNYKNKGKIYDSLIKAHMSTFCKSIDEKFHFEENMRNRKSISLKVNNANINSPKSSNTNNYLFGSKDSTIPSSE